MEIRGLEPRMRQCHCRVIPFHYIPMVGTSNGLSPSCLWPRPEVDCLEIGSSLTLSESVVQTHYTYSPFCVAKYNTFVIFGYTRAVPASVDLALPARQAGVQSR